MTFTTKSSGVYTQLFQLVHMGHLEPLPIFSAGNGTYTLDQRRSWFGQGGGSGTTELVIITVVFYVQTC